MSFLQGLPRNILAFLAIAGGIAFIVMSSPPHTVCESQMEVFANSQKSFLYPDPKSKLTKSSKFDRLRDHCKVTNSPGGCYELFQELKSMLKELDSVPSDCYKAAAGKAEIKKALWQTAELMVELAWSDKPPTTYFQKFGWLDTADISLFCQLKTKISLFFGEREWEKFRERMFTELPGSKDLPRSQVWDMSIFSENCARYP